MALITGSPQGLITTPQDIFLEGAPNIWLQDCRAGAPSIVVAGTQYYTGMSGTTLYPALELGCVEGVQLSDNVTMNDIRCDTTGVQDTMQRRNYLELTMTLKTVFPFAVLSAFLRGSAVDQDLTKHLEIFGLGKINNTLCHRIYMAGVYNEETNAWYNITMHKAKFVDAWQLAMRAGDGWQLSNVKIRGFAQSLYSTKQQFATVMRVDSENI